MIFNYKNTPLCNNVEVQNINVRNPSKFLKSLSSFEILSEVSQFCDLQCSDSYYSVHDFQNTNLEVI